MAWRRSAADRLRRRRTRHRSLVGDALPPAVGDLARHPGRGESCAVGGHPLGQLHLRLLAPGLDGLGRGRRRRPQAGSAVLAAPTRASTRLTSRARALRSAGEDPAEATAGSPRSPATGAAAGARRAAAGRRASAGCPAATRARAPEARPERAHPPADRGCAPVRARRDRLELASSAPASGSIMRHMIRKLWEKLRSLFDDGGASERRTNEREEQQEEAEEL